ncbi:MAG: ABC transporter ATP-binding protein [Acidobacteria bacterium]|nr:ABC transporter ATP-binding protein [Acidobacteriota bacterium]
MALSELLIEVRDLRFRYEGGDWALAGVNFRLSASETVALLGPNGSGKTTFVLHLNGLLAGEGEITVCGLAVVKKNLPLVRQKVGIVFQDSEDQLFMPTVLEDVAFGPLNLGMSAHDSTQRALEALERVGMAASAGQAPYHLSAGEKRRVAIAGILAMQPEILVLDEPTTHLDPPSKRSLVELLHELPQAKILVTHDLDFARPLASRAVFFESGKVAADGSLERIVQDFGWESPYVRRSNAGMNASHR